jgi:anti-sigma-K factor RskA
VELELVGQMTFQQARVDLAALEFRGRPMGAGAVTVGGRNLKIVASLDANGKTTAVEVEPAPGTSAGRPREGVVDDG